MYKAVMYTLGKMGHISNDEFSIRRAHEGVSIWTFSFSDFLRKFYKSLMHKCLRRFGVILKMSFFSHFLAFFQVNSQKYGLFRIMGRCIGRFGRSRKIVRGPRGTNFPPHATNLSLCPNDFSLQKAPRP